jgi:hypothetical protein
MTPASRKQLATALSLLVDCASLYARTGEQGKRLANQALTNGNRDQRRRKGDDPTRRALRRPHTDAGTCRCQVF